MKNEVERLLNGRGLETQKDNKSLTQKLRQWRADRNITKADYLTFVENVLEELMEPIWEKSVIQDKKSQIISDYFYGIDEYDWNEEEIIDAIQDIQVFCINETELMGYDNLKCNDEVFKEINSREQDPQQLAEWQKFGASEKWQKRKDQNPNTLYKANYESCKL